MELDEIIIRIATALNIAIEKGFESPLYMVAVAVNGSMLYVRYVSPGLDPEVLSEFYQDESFRLPVNIMLLDSRGRAARILIEKDQKPTLTTLH